MTIKQQGGIFGRNPSFNDLEAEQATVNGTVNIQSNRPQIFFYEQDRTDNNARIECSFDNLNISQVDDSNGSAVARLTVEMDTGDVYVNDGNLVIGTSGKGIDFSATSGTGTSELFDDYEEGTWTPTLSNFAGTPTVSGSYTKVGNLVYLECSVQLDGTSDASNYQVTGLPYTPTDVGGGYISRTDGGYADGLVSITPASSRIDVKDSSNSGVNYNTFGNSSTTKFVVFYRVA